MLSTLLVLSMLAMAGCANTGPLGKDARIKLEYSPTASYLPHLIDARPVSEKSFRTNVIQGYQDSVALGDENFNPDRIRVLGIRLHDALGTRLKDTDEAVVERFEVFEYVKDVKTPTPDEVVDMYDKSGVTRMVPATALAMPLIVPVRQLIDQSVTSVAQVELRVKINGQPFSSNMSAGLQDVDREYGISEAFNLSFKYLVYDIEAGLKQ